MAVDSRAPRGVTVFLGGSVVFFMVRDKSRRLGGDQLKDNPCVSVGDLQVEAGHNNSILEY